MTLFVVFHVLVCVFLVFVILLQPGKSDAGIGFGSSSQSIFGSRGAGNFLTKTTSACAILFLITSFALTKSRIKEAEKTIMDNEPPPAPATDTKAPAAPTPSVSTEPATKPVEPKTGEKKK